MFIFEYLSVVPNNDEIEENIIPIYVGELHLSLRSFADLCNRHVRYQEDLICKSTVKRAIDYFEKCGFLKQKTFNGKTILTVFVNK